MSGVRSLGAQQQGFAELVAGSATGAPADPSEPVQLPGGPVRTIQRRPGAAPRGREARARGRGEQAPRCSRPIGRVSRLAQGQDSRVTGGEPGAVATL